MLTFFTVVLIGSLAYALGSVSPGWFAGRARGLDLRFEGQETLGFVNAANVLGTSVGVMVFAVVQKLLSPEYLRGDFWGYFLSFGLAGKFVFATGFWDGTVEVFRQNREFLAALGGSGLTDGAAATL